MAPLKEMPALKAESPPDSKEKNETANAVLLLLRVRTLEAPNGRRNRKHERRRRAAPGMGAVFPRILFAGAML
jgi:hypothetical protein